MIIRHGRAVSQGKQGLFWGGAAGRLPSPPPAGALSPAGSGDAAQWAASITDRRGSGDQALNGAHWAPAPPKGGGKTWSSASLWRAALSVLANAGAPPPKGEARLGLLQASGGLPSPSSLTRVHLPQRGRRDLAFCKPLAGCLLGSPFGGAGTALAVTERASRWPHRPALGKPLSRCATVRERRGKAPVSLAFSHALRA